MGRYSNQNSLLLKLSVLSYVVSLFLPVQAGGWDTIYIGIVVSTFGVFAAFSDVLPLWAGLSWLANIPWFLSWRTKASRFYYQVSSVLALALALLFLGVQKIPANEAGDLMDASPGPGYYFWLLALLLRLGAAYR